jgi:hypothetical protein
MLIPLALGLTEHHVVPRVEHTQLTAEKPAAN